MTLTALALAAGLSGCGDNDDDRATEPTVDEVETLIVDSTTAWLDGFNDPQDTPLTCPGEATNVVVTPSDSSMRACLYLSGVTFYVRVQNLTGAPMSTWGAADIFGNVNTFTVQPAKYLDLALTNLQFGQSLSYAVNLPAGVTAIVTDEIESHIDDLESGGLSWAGCVVDPDEGCVLDAFVSMVPTRVTFRGRSIPTRTFAKALNLAYQNIDIVHGFGALTQNLPPGTLTFQEQL